MRINYPTYHEELMKVKYPFSETATLTNGDVFIENDIFVDGRIFPPLASVTTFISGITIDITCSIVLSDEKGIVGIAEFEKSNPPSVVNFYSNTNAYVGLLVGYEHGGIKKLTNWPVGSYEFSSQATCFSPTVLVPQPQECVRSITLADGSVFTGPVALVGENGVQLTCPKDEENTIQVDIVGDPLYTKRLCNEEAATFSNDTIFKILDYDGTSIKADNNGSINITIAIQEHESPALRITKDGANSIKIGFVSK